jgi:hypothetical protein
MSDLCNAGVVKEGLRVGPDGNPGTARTTFHRAGRCQAGVRGPQLFQSEIIGHDGHDHAESQYYLALIAQQARRLKEGLEGGRGDRDPYKTYQHVYRSVKGTENTPTITLKMLASLH